MDRLPKTLHASVRRVLGHGDLGSDLVYGPMGTVRRVCRNVKRWRSAFPFVPITDFVDTSRPRNANDHIRLGEMKRFGKAVLGGGRRKCSRTHLIAGARLLSAFGSQKTSRRTEVAMNTMSAATMPIASSG